MTPSLVPTCKTKRNPSACVLQLRVLQLPLAHGHNCRLVDHNRGSRRLGSSKAITVTVGTAELVVEGAAAAASTATENNQADADKRDNDPYSNSSSRNFAARVASDVTTVCRSIFDAPIILYLPGKSTTLMTKKDNARTIKMLEARMTRGMERVD